MFVLDTVEENIKKLTRSYSECSAIMSVIDLLQTMVQFLKRKDGTVMCDENGNKLTAQDLEQLANQLDIILACKTVEYSED